MYFCDSAQHYDDIGLAIAGKWAGIFGSHFPPVYSATGGRSDGPSLACRTYETLRESGIYKYLDNQPAIVVQFMLRFSGGTLPGWPLFSVFAGSTDLIDLYLNSSGHFCFVKNGTTLLEEGTYTYSVATEVYVEAKIVIDGSSGICQLKVNGSSSYDIDYSGNTLTGGVTLISQINFFNAAASPDFQYTYYSDVIIATGTSDIQTFGQCNVDAYFPASAGSNTNWTPSTGSNYTCVNKTTPSADSKYVSSITDTQKDTYAYGNMSTTPNSIPFVQQMVYGNRDVGGTSFVKPVCLSSGTESDGSSMSMGTSAAYSMQIWITDPHTSAAWTKTGFNAAEFGVMYSNT